MIGALVGDRYRITQVLGEGGMGLVYVANDDSLHRDVAVKVLNAEYADKSSVVERFVKEAIAACRVKHPGGVVEVFEHGWHESDP